MERRPQYPPEFITKHGQQILFDKTVIPQVLNIDTEVDGENVTLTDPPHFIKVASSTGRCIIYLTMTEPGIINFVKDDSENAFDLVVVDKTHDITLLELPADVGSGQITVIPSVVNQSRPKTMADIAYSEITKQGVREKFDAVASGSDTLYEELKYKHIKEPFLNDPDAAHGYVFLKDASPMPFNAIRIMVRKPCSTSDPDQWTMTVDNHADAFGFNVPDAGRGYSIDCPSGTTVAELIKYLSSDSDFVSLFTATKEEHAADTTVIGALATTNFIGGAGGHVLAATGEEIDDTVAKRPTSGPPVTAQSPATGTTGTGDTEILWTANTSGYNGTAGDGIKITVVFDSEVTGAVVSVKAATDILVSVEASGDPLHTAVTCTDVINAVAAYPAAAALLSGVLQGGGGTVLEGTVTLAGGEDITAAPAGAIRYESTKIWISTDESTATESNWKSVDLTDPNA